MNAPMVKNVVLFRVVGTMAEFKQIIGRGTRVREDYGKLFFTILNYTGTATQKFADPEFDGPPISTTEITLGADGTPEQETIQEGDQGEDTHPPRDRTSDDDDWQEPRKFVVRSGVQVQVLHETVQELDEHGRQLRTVEFTSYAAEQVRSMYVSADDFRHHWVDARQRQAIVQALEERGVALEHLEQVMGLEDSDPFDLLCHLAFGAPLLTRKQRVEAARRQQDAHVTYGPLARTILDQLPDQYAQHGIHELGGADVFKVLPATRHMNIQEIGRAFGGLPKLRQLLDDLPSIIYARSA
ncbi:hypothetical protein LAJ19_13440 [Deinococcus taeanensis]|nr:type I restriction endonuclease subunit R [Deinococcus taeanensis]UBV42609.1 hypothetical protein LAJ19_13440 [Deinococcus taeanensis]